MTGLAAHLASAPSPLRIVDAAAAARAREGLAGALGRTPQSDPVGAFLDAVFSAAPYLARSARRFPATVEAALAQPPETVVAELCEDLETALSDCAVTEAAQSAIRRAKGQAHLVIALADLAGYWDWASTARALSQIADACLQGALRVTARQASDRGRCPSPDTDNSPIKGVFVAALGKHGAFELNYSSDIDIVVFFDPSALDLAAAVEPQAFLNRTVQRLCALLSERTALGYGFRVDLRLRPDPGATPVAVNVDMAERYYEALGQNWERAALIKARIAAGDAEAGAAFLARLDPFIWRKYLDHAAIDDIHAIKRQIQSVGDRARIHPPGSDVKLGKGGIREIEFYVQTQQLLFGGRFDRLRAPRTLEALSALTTAGFVADGDRQTLAAAYGRLRDIEHRIQMLEDQQTHILPVADTDRDRVAALTGYPDLGAFDADVIATKRAVHARYSTLFADGAEDDAAAAPPGDWVFTGVEPEPATLATLAGLGFSNPAQVWEQVRAWRAGRVRATRTPRARSALTRFTPALLVALSETGQPDTAFVRFADFFAGLPAGVQVLSLMAHAPALRARLIRMLALAPRLGQTLARRPVILDALLNPQFDAPLDAETEDDIRAAVGRALAPAQTLESALDAARVFGREALFRIGAHVLDGRASAHVAGGAYARLADALCCALSQAAHAEIQRRHGAITGEFAVIALGTFGGREMAAGSDLDLMLVYDVAAGVATSEGPRSLAPEVYFARLTQRLIAALSAPTAEGELYAVDMQLRPSGKAGPIAVRLSAFERYYAGDAWTWELMALTRARVIACGCAALQARAEAAIRSILTQPRDKDVVAAAVCDMRRRLERERPAASPWDLKRAPAGLIDLEFIAHYLQLVHGADHPDCLQTSTKAALAACVKAGLLGPPWARPLSAACALYADLNQWLQIVSEGPFDPAQAPNALKGLLAEAVGAEDFTALEAALGKAQTSVRAAFDALVGPLAGDGNSEPSR
ncbi:MAG: bifunctional [glutamine synthetase] adenylyltransferase/[glutamine synthetase]-adenylyl-L-tyrosine phosphorylase [Maricaulaceae bacterium]